MSETTPLYPNAGGSSELSGLASWRQERIAAMGGRYVGFYWTLPVNWAGFRWLPNDADAAAAASRTIRYQRERVSRFVAGERGTLVDEIAFMDVQPDRATDVVREVLRGKAARYAGTATLVTVAFDEAHRWRYNPYLLDAAEAFGFQLLPLSPDPVIIDGVEFNPARHFAHWRKQDRSTKTRLEYEALHGLRAALVTMPPGDGRWQAIAARLNAGGVRTIRGGVWTAENVRKLAGRLERMS
jgi:hypothetical protein